MAEYWDLFEYQNLCKCFISKNVLVEVFSACTKVESEKAAFTLEIVTNLSKWHELSC